MKLYGAIYEAPPEPNKNPHFPEEQKAATPSSTEKKDQGLWVLIIIAVMIAVGYLLTRRW